MSKAKGGPESAGDLRTMRHYHGTRVELKDGDLIEPSTTEGDGETSYAYLTSNLDAAIWEAELALGEGGGRVYIVEPTGEIEDASKLKDREAPGHPWMSLRSREPLRVMGEVTEWMLYHGTRAELKPGDLIQAGRIPNIGDKERPTNYVYFTRTLDAAAWGAELAVGEGRGRIYVVEPTGPMEDDPNLTNKKFRGNPTKSFRSREPLRILGELSDWQGHPAEAIKAMKDGLEKLKRLGFERIEE